VRYPAPGCEATESDELVAEPVEALDDLQRADIVVFQTPPEAQAKCGAGGTFVKRVVGLPGETVEIRLRESEGKAYVYVNGKMLDEPYIENDRRDIGRRKHIECRPSTTS